MSPLLATAPEPGEDLGHLVPDDVWAQVVAGAEARAAELLEQAEQEALPGLLGVVDRTISARSHGGTMPGGPRLGVVHSAETPLRAGYAYSIAANWFATRASTSATVMIDPAETIRLLPDNVVAYHVGPAGNGFTVGAEQAGYARLSRAEWLSPAGRAQKRRLAEYMVDCWRAWGIPLRWATDAQIRAAAAGGPPQGWCVHDDIRRVLGGTVHTDPMPNYPRDELMALARAIAAGEDDDMPYTEEQLRSIIRSEVKAVMTEPGPRGVPDRLANRVRAVLRDVDTKRTFGILLRPLEEIRAKLVGDADSPA